MKEFNFYFVNQNAQRCNKTFKAYNLNEAYYKAKAFAKKYNMQLIIL